MPFADDHDRGDGAATRLAPGLDLRHGSLGSRTRPSMWKTRARAALALGLGAVTAASAASPRTPSIVVELEPNGTKVEANPVACLAPGVRIQGVTTGSGTAPGDASIASADTFLFEVCPLAPGIWRHRLAVTTVGSDEHTLSLRGLAVNGPPASPSIAAGTDVALQVSVGGPGQPHSVQWYGFGRAEHYYARVAGTANTVAPYELELDSQAVVPVTVPAVLRTGTIEITTAGQGHITDTEIFVLDGNLVAIPGFRNDDEPSGATRQSRLTRSFAPGVYFLAVARFNLADALLSGADDGYQLAPVADFGDGVLSWSPSGASNVSFAMTDSVGTTAVPAFLGPDPFEVAWFRFVVADPPPPVAAACPGDGTGAPCPCGNTGAAGRGCANSVNPLGGVLAASGIASLSVDSFLLAGSGMPVSSALYFQGTSLLGGGNGVAFGDGLRCAGGTVVRLETKTNFGGGSQYPGAGDPPISVRGLIPPLGGARAYQVWYRNSDPGYCTPAYFNLTNAITATWIP